MSDFTKLCLATYWQNEIEKRNWLAQLEQDYEAGEWAPGGYTEEEVD